MHWLLNLRLVTLTAGTLLPFFWMVVILGHRRQRNFERIFFFLCLALTCFFGSSLLALNAQLFYGAPPPGLLRFAWTFLCLGLWFIPPLIVHLHVEYASLRELFRSEKVKAIWIAFGYLPALLLLPYLWNAVGTKNVLNFVSPTYVLGSGYLAWLLLALGAAGYWEWRFRRVAPDSQQRAFHSGAALNFAILAVLLLVVFWEQASYGPGTAAQFDAVILLLALSPLAFLILEVQRFNFLQIGRQRNLIYAVFGIFVALLYLSLVRRASQWLEPYLPPEATAALLLFLPVVFFEPLQRIIRRLLRQTAQSEVDRAQKLIRPISEVARGGDLEQLRVFAESWITEQLQLAEVRLALHTNGSERGNDETHRRGSEEMFEIRRGHEHFGSLAARPHGAMVSGETYAALEFVCEQLPAAFDLCLLIEEKLQLERELAERERLALVGQMAASISHNLKNPLGSIKTILQVQMESPELPTSLRGETQMVLDEINRLSAKLNQLLQFSRPGVRRGSGRDRCEVAGVATAVIEVLRHEAERSGIVLELAGGNGQCEVAAGAEAANDILSNIVLNAIEAVGRGGKVRVQWRCSESACTVTVEDDGPGIPAALQEKIIQPFFTTKPRGTGLGLAIVARRLEELGGTLAWQSPIENGRGTRFQLNFPLAETAADVRDLK